MKQNPECIDTWHILGKIGTECVSSMLRKIDHGSISNGFVEAAIKIQF